MFKISRSLIAAVAMGSAVMLSAPALAQASPVLGSWETVLDTPVGELKSTMTFAQQSGAYTVDIKDAPMPGAPEGAAPAPSAVSEVMVNGAKFSFKRSLETPQGAIALTYTGTVDGNALTGEANSDFGAVPMKGTRVGS